jgi:hypothetical protein
MEKLEFLPEELEFNKYDNNVAKLYKWAIKNNIPTKFVLIKPREANDKDFEGTDSHYFISLPVFVLELFQNHESLSTVYSLVHELSDRVTVEDITMIYYEYLRDQGMNARNTPDAKTRKEILATINREYNDIYESAEPKFSRYEDLISDYDNWNTLIRGSGEREMEVGDVIRVVKDKPGIMDFEAQTANKILDIEATLEVVDEANTPLDFGTVTLNSTVVAFSPTLQGEIINLNDGIELFDQTKTSEFVPFIRYNDSQGHPYYHVIDELRELVYVLDKGKNEPNWFSLLLWLGIPGVTSKLSRGSYIMVYYNLETNYLTLELPNTSTANIIYDDREAIRRVADAFPTLDFGVGKETKVKGDFKIWNASFDEITFMDGLLRDPVLSAYLYVLETTNPQALKKRIDVFFNSIGEKKHAELEEGGDSSVAFTLTQHVTVNRLETDIGSQQKEYPANTPYINVTITSGTTKKSVQDFIPIFNLLMQYYMDYKTRALKPYLEKLGPIVEHADQFQEGQDLEEAVPAKRKKIKGTRKGEETPLEALRRVAPELIPPSYTRECEKKYQPTPIPDDQIEDWTSQTLPDGNKKQVMQFPYPNPKWNFKCESKVKPYPGLKLNTDKTTYPYIPCCFGNDQMTEGANSLYRDYVEGKPVPTVIGTKGKGKIKSEKVLGVGGKGPVAESIKSIVSRSTDETVEVVRFGAVGADKNSLIHCVLTALQDEGYDLAKDKTNYVEQLRKKIALEIRPGLLRQEFYDLSNPEITQRLKDTTTDYDPALYYRALEEYFNVNIYVFTQKGTGGGEIELPRHRLFHSRPARLYRPTILIMKIYGSESNKLDYPQCELIAMEQDKSTDLIMLFGLEMTTICHQTLMEANKTLTWDSNPSDITLFNVHSNLYYHLDHLELMQTPAISQYIDDYGKVRALTFILSGKKYITLATLPSQPENLPTVPLSKLRTTDASLAISLLGEPTGQTVNAEGLTDGLWFQMMDVKYAEYVMIDPEKLNYVEGPSNPVIVLGEQNYTERLHTLKRTLNILTQLIKWLYSLALLNERIDPVRFTNKYLVVENNVSDSMNFYDLRGIPRRFPLVETAKDGILALKKLAPTLFRGNKLIMYDADFANKIIKMLQDFDATHNTLALDIPEYIYDYYETEEDFTQQEGSKVFLGTADLDTWLNANISNKIHTRITVSMAQIMTPFIYQDEDGHIYIIQNVVGGIEEKAWNVGYHWMTEEKNIGADVEPYEGDPPAHLIYGLSNNNTMIRMVDKTGDSNRYISELYYGPIQNKLKRDVPYAAVLEIF